MTNNKQLSNSTTRSQLYRKQHRRFDYVPADDVLQIIELYMSKYPNWSIRLTIDALLRTAHKHIENRKNSVS